MNSDTLKIQWDTGHMTIYMPAFFPCTEGQLKKLKKIMTLDWEQNEALLAKMQAYFNESIPKCEEDLVRYGKQYWHYCDKQKKYEKQLAEGKTPIGLSLTKEQKKNWKQCAKVFAASARVSKRNALQAKKHKEWFIAHADKEVQTSE